MCLSLQGKKGRIIIAELVPFAYQVLPTNYLYCMQSFKLDIIPTLKTRNLRPREVKQLG